MRRGIRNPFYYYDKAIISIDTLKQDAEYRTYLEEARWDIIVIDEAHNVADRGTGSLRSRLAKLLARQSDTLIMLSATPHDGKARSFASLVNMPDATAIANPDEDEYTKADFRPGLVPGEAVFVFSGLVPNRKSHPLVHEWVAVSFRDGALSELIPFTNLVERTGPWGAGTTPTVNRPWTCLPSRGSCRGPYTAPGSTSSNAATRSRKPSTRSSKSRSERWTNSGPAGCGSCSSTSSTRGRTRTGGSRPHSWSFACPPPWSCRSKIASSS